MGIKLPCSLVRTLSASLPNTALHSLSHSSRPARIAPRAKLSLRGRGGSLEHVPATRIRSGARREVCSLAPLVLACRAAPPQQGHQAACDGCHRTTHRVTHRTTCTSSVSASERTCVRGSITHGGQKAGNADVGRGEDCMGLRRPTALAMAGRTVLLSIPATGASTPPAGRRVS